MDDFSSARPNTEEGASQGARFCKAYVSSCFAFRITASWGAQSHNCGRFESFSVSRGAQSQNFGCANNKYIVCHTMVVCCCVSRYVKLP